MAAGKNEKSQVLVMKYYYPSEYNSIVAYTRVHKRNKNVFDKIDQKVTKTRLTELAYPPALGGPWMRWQRINDKPQVFIMKYYYPL